MQNMELRRVNSLQTRVNFWLRKKIQNFWMRSDNTMFVSYIRQRYSVIF